MTNKQLKKTTQPNLPKVYYNIIFLFVFTIISKTSSVWIDINLYGLRHAMSATTITRVITLG